MLKTLLAQVKQYKKPSVLTPVFMAGEVLMETILPILMAKIIDDGISAGDMNKVYIYGFLMIVMAGCSLTFGVLAGRMAANASTGFAANIRNAMYDNIQTFAFKNIDKFSTAGLVTRLTTDVTNIQNAYQMILRMCVRAPLSMIFSMIMCFVISAKLSLIFVAAIIFLGLFLYVLIIKTMNLFRAMFKKYDALNESVQENIAGIRVVKSFVREDYEKNKFTKASEGIYKIGVKAESKIAKNMPAMLLASYVCVLLIAWFGAHLIVSNSLTTGELTSLLTYVMTILMNLMMVSMIFVMITMSVASAQRVAEVLDEKSSLTNPENPDFDINDGSVDFEDVTFAYHQDRPVLKNINIHINSGETIGVVGGTGSSKSSLVNLISRLYDVTDGSVKVGGKDVRNYDLETLRNNVAVVLQKNVLFSGTILDNLRWGDENATEEECINACKLACADEFISKMPEGYNTHIEQGGTNVSGGQKQRLCIARALLKKPRILILDDSTSAVDTATDAKIRKAFNEEIPGTTKFIIAQRISSVQNADKIIVLENGEINGFDTHENLLKNNDIYREVYESQTKGGGDFDEKGGTH